jgi:hypothetical protein
MDSRVPLVVVVIQGMQPVITGELQEGEASECGQRIELQEKEVKEKKEEREGEK